LENNLVEISAKALDSIVRSHDFREPITVREFLHKLLEEVWLGKESFSGKRPFGNSGWEYPLYDTLVRDGFIEGKSEIIDEGTKYEQVEYFDYDRKAADAYIHGLIKIVFFGEQDENQSND
jgi:hypothetical protein